MLRKVSICVLPAPSLPELRRSSTPYGVVKERDAPYPALRFACTGLSKSDAFRRPLVSHKKSCVT
jgi:hypothetical protein